MYKQEYPIIEAYNIDNNSEEPNKELQSIDIESVVNESVPSELVQLFKAVFWVEACKNTKLSAYKARKQCFKICKKQKLDKNYYKPCIEAIQMNYFPKEFKKAELGKRYIVLRNWIILACWTGIGLLLLPFFILRMKKLSKQIKEL